VELNDKYNNKIDCFDDFENGVYQNDDYDICSVNCFERIRVFAERVCLNDEKDTILYSNFSRRCNTIYNRMTYSLSIIDFK
jgi:hypothetical protein